MKILTRNSSLLIAICFLLGDPTVCYTLAPSSSFSDDGTENTTHEFNDFLSRIADGFSSIERPWEISVNEECIPAMHEDQKRELANAFRVYAALRKNTDLDHAVNAFLDKLNRNEPFRPRVGADRQLLHDLNHLIPPPPQATGEFVDWSNAEMVMAYRKINQFLDQYLPQAKIPRWHYSFEHLRLAQSLINGFLAPALVSNPETAGLAKSLRGLGMKFSEKAIDYVRIPYSKDRLTAFKRLGFSADKNEFASSGKVALRHAHGMFYTILMDFPAGQAVNIDEIVAPVEPLRARDQVDPEWLDMREVYSAVQAGLAGQVHILEDVPADVKSKAMEFLDKQHWPELELVEDHAQEWADGKFRDILTGVMPDLDFALRPDEVPLVEVGVRVGDLATVADGKAEPALMRVYRPNAGPKESRLAYVQRVGDTVLYNGFVEGKIPEGFQPPFFEPRYGVARWITRHQTPFIFLLGHARFAKVLIGLVGRDRARMLYIEYPDEPWLQDNSMGRKFRDNVDGLLGPGAWKYFVDHRTLRFTGETQRSLLDRLLRSPQLNDFDAMRQTLGLLGFEERERYNPLNTDWEAQVVWIKDHGHSSFFLDKPLDGLRGKVAKFSAVWRALHLFGVNPPPRNYAPPMPSDKWKSEEIATRIAMALGVNDASDRRYLLLEWKRWLAQHQAHADLLPTVESGLGQTSAAAAFWANTRRFLRAAFTSPLLLGPTPIKTHHHAMEGVFEEIGANLSRDTDKLALRKDRMTAEEINSGFIARFSKKVSRRQAFSLESRVLQPWLLSLAYFWGRLGREELLQMYEDACPFDGRVLTVEGPHYENIDRRAGMHKFDQGKVDIAIKTASEGEGAAKTTAEGFLTRAVSAVRWTTVFYALKNRNPEYWKMLRIGSTAVATYPIEDAKDVAPILVWVDDTAKYQLPGYLMDLPVQIKERDLSEFGRDESGGTVMKVAAVIAPRTETQLAEILKRFTAQKKPLTVASANTGLSRGAVPAGQGEEVLSMREFIHLPVASQPDVHYRLGADEDGTPFAAVAPGVRLMDLQSFVENENLYYPPDPTERTSLVGGNVATNASGARTLKYGPTRDWVRALRVVLANGDVLDLRRGEVFADNKGCFTIKMTDGSTRIVQIPKYTMPALKNAAGYYAKPHMDLIDLFIGSEGTLGVITQVEVALIPKPAHRYTGNVYFPSEEKAMAFVKAMRAAKGKDGIDPSLLEYFDGAAVDIIRKKDTGISQQSKTAVYFEQEITDLKAASLEDDPVVERWREIMMQHDAQDIQEAFGDAARVKLRDLRHSVPEDVNRQITQVSQRYEDAGISKVATDIAVPDDKLEEMMTFYKSVLTRTAMKYVVWGHIGNNHLHVNMLPQNPAQYKQAKEILVVFARKAAEMGGTITAEHGTGKIKIPQLEIMFGPDAIAEMVKVKEALDPAGILGRGNIFEMPTITASVLSAKPKANGSPATNGMSAQMQRLIEADPFVNGSFEEGRLSWSIRAGLNDRRLRVKAVTIEQIERDFADPQTTWLLQADMRSCMHTIILTPRGENRAVSLQRLARGNIKSRDWIYGPENPNGAWHLMDAVDKSKNSVNVDDVIERFRRELVHVMDRRRITPDVWNPFVEDPEDPQEQARFVMALDEGLSLSGESRGKIRAFHVLPGVRLSEIVSLLDGLFRLPLRALVSDEKYCGYLLAAGFSQQDLKHMKDSPKNQIIPPSAPDMEKIWEKVNKERQIQNTLVDGSA